MKRGFPGRDKFNAFKDAVNARRTLMDEHKAELLKQLTVPGINIYKQVELWKNFRPPVPDAHRGNELYQKPPEDIMQTVKAEKKMRKDLRGELNKMKQKANKAAKVKVEAAAWM